MAMLNNQRVTLHLPKTYLSMSRTWCPKGQRDPQGSIEKKRRPWLPGKSASKLKTVTRSCGEGPLYLQLFINIAGDFAICKATIVPSGKLT